MSPARFCFLPLLRVQVRPDGKLVTHHREGARPPIDEGWWRDVLFDPRARLPVDHYIPAHSTNARYRLDRQGDWFQIECRCGKTKTFDVAPLIKEFGADANIVWLARELMPCKSRNKVSNFCAAVPRRF